MFRISEEHWKNCNSATMGKTMLLKLPQHTVCNWRSKVSLGCHWDCKFLGPVSSRCVLCFFCHSRPYLLMASTSVEPRIRSSTAERPRSVQNQDPSCVSKSQSIDKLTVLWMLIYVCMEDDGRNHNLLCWMEWNPVYTALWMEQILHQLVDPVRRWLTLE